VAANLHITINCIIVFAFLLLLLPVVVGGEVEVTEDLN
jgi:hypothetical protein